MTILNLHILLISAGYAVQTTVLVDQNPRGYLQRGIHELAFSSFVYIVEIKKRFNGNCPKASLKLLSP
jgi:hypothetical protein